MPAQLALLNVAWTAPDGRPVLSGITASFARERTGIVGRNGAGKSTLLSLLAGRGRRPLPRRVFRTRRFGPHASAAGRAGG